LNDGICPILFESAAVPMDKSESHSAIPDLVAGFDADALRADGAKDRFTIRDLTREFEVTARTLRFYEEKGLLAPERAGQERLYSRRDRARLKYVLMGKCVGFSLEEIRDMLDLYDLGDGQVTQLRVAHGRFIEQIDRLKRQRTEIDRALAELERARTTVAGMLAARGA
jgi:DNA-binding transcriptional MerR regulator